MPEEPPSRDLRRQIAELTPDQRARLEQRLLEVKPRPAHPPTLPRERPTPLPVSFAQQRLWFLDRLEPQQGVYNIPRAVRLRGTLDVEALRGALDVIVERHEALRTTFASADGVPSQRVTTPRPVDLRIVDLGAWPAAEREAEARCLLGEAAMRPFDLASDLMLRASLARLDADDHVLLLVLHHIAADGWSMGILSRELSALYESFTAGRAPELRPLPIQYADYAVRQRQSLTGAVLETQISYWRHRLADAPPVLELPYDRPRPPLQTYRGASTSFALPGSLTEALRTLSRGEGVTLFMVLLSALQTLLGRYSGSTDVVVGSPIAGRTRVDTEGLIGFFVNNLALRTDLSGNPTFRELLRRTREVALGAYTHQELPFEKLVEELAPPRSLSYSPIFQVMLAFQNTPSAALQLRGLSATRFDTERTTSRFDLTLSIEETERGLQGSCEYSTDLFDASTIGRFLGHFHRLLEGAVEHPDTPLSRLPMLTDAERRQILIKWNETTADYPRDTCVHHLVQAQVARTPHAVAIAFEGVELTYRDLDQRANHVAHLLRARGVGPGAVVGVHVDRSPQMVIGMLGILKAGAAYLPLDPTHPSARLAWILTDAAVTTVVTEARHLPRLSGYAADLICLDSLHETSAESSPPAGGAGPEHLAYVMYTSGSTGAPKGVEIAHGSLVNFLHAMRTTLGLTTADVLVAVTTLSFDIAVLELFLPLIVGARVVIVDGTVAADGVRLGDVLTRTHANIMQATPTTWRLLLDSGWRGDSAFTVLCGGEQLPRDLADALLERCGTVWNLYGPTEATVWSAAHRVGPGSGSVPIGRPIANTRMYVLDADLQPVPVGHPGNLYIAGIALARGYRNRPEWTAERFIRGFFDDPPEVRLYRTGDRARYRADGSLEYLGREDHQIKLRGFRIEPAEVETALRTHPAVREAIVVARAEGAADSRLVAYVEPTGETTPEPAALRDVVRARLPPYMVPSDILVLDAFPLTPNGKIDRAQLPAPGGSVAPGSSFVAPRDPLELQLVGVWERVLARKPVGVTDSFFDLGGHSLLAVRLFAEIEALTKRRLPLASLFQAPTVESLADSLRREGWTAPWRSLVAIRPGGSRRPLFCVHPHGGEVLCYRGLARHLGEDQPVYGLQAQGLDGAQLPFCRVEELATQYLEEICTIQPQGPYQLAGYCFGGTVAFEMARQLASRGERVAVLALIETFAPSYLMRIRRTLFRLAERIDQEFRALPPLGSRALLTHLGRKANRALGRIGQPIEHHAQATAALEVAHLAARRRYLPRPYPGRLILFRPPLPGRTGDSDPALGWRSVAVGGVDIQEIPGSHVPILSEPRVQILAHRLRLRIQAVDGPGS